MPLGGFDSDKTRALLGYLVVEADHRHRRDYLAGFFWPEKPEILAHHNLSQALYNLHHILQDLDGKNPLATSPQDVQYIFDKHTWLDIRALDENLRQCENHHHPVKLTCGECLSGLEQTLELYHGDFFAGLFIEGCQEVEAWAMLKRETCRQKAIQIATWLAKGYEQVGEHEKALLYARQLAYIDPAGEENQ